MPNKRHATPSAYSSLLVPAAKRAHSGDAFSTKTATLDSFPTIEEVVHHIFSYLNAQDLCTIQLVSRFWSRLASDNQLWKTLFLREHPLHRLRGGKSSYSRSFRMLPTAPGREIKPLPHRATTTANTKQGHDHSSLLQRDYKWLYRIARNWKRGRCARSRVYNPLSLPFSAHRRMRPPAEPTQIAPGAQCVVLAGPYIIVASGAFIYLHVSDPPRHTNDLTPKRRDMNGSYGAASTILGESFSNNVVELASSDASDITAVALDQSWPSSFPPSERDQEWNKRTCSSRIGLRHEGEIHVAAFHRSGHFDVFSIVSSNPRVDDHFDPNNSPLPDLGSRSSREHGPANAKLIYSHPALPSPRVPIIELPTEADFARSRMSNIMCAAYHHPLLITLSKNSHLLVYCLPDLHVPPSQGCGVTMATSLPVRPVLVRSVHSYTSYMPSSMSLTRVPGSSASTHLRRTMASAVSRQNNGTALGGDALFKLVLAYTVPVYPTHWTAGAAELTITVGHSTGAWSQATTSSAGTMMAGQPDVRIVSSRTASAMPNGWHELPVTAAPRVLPSETKEDVGEGEGAGTGNNEDFEYATLSLPTPFAQHVKGERDHRYTSIAHVPASSTSGDLTMRLNVSDAMEQWTRKLGNVVGTQTDGKWIVIAGNDNVLQVYRLHRPPGSSISIQYSHSLYGHTAGIAALRVTDARCVSVGREGGLWVWDLEAGGSAVGVNIGPTRASGNVGVEPDMEAGDFGLSSSSHSLQMPHLSDAPPPLVVFDEQRVVASLGRGGLDMWDFNL